MCRHPQTERIACACARSILRETPDRSAKHRFTETQKRRLRTALQLLPRHGQTKIRLASRGRISRMRTRGLRASHTASMGAYTPRWIIRWPAVASILTRVRWRTARTRQCSGIRTRQIIRERQPYRSTVTRKRLCFRLRSRSTAIWSTESSILRARWKTLH